MNLSEYPITNRAIVRAMMETQLTRMEMARLFTLGQSEVKYAASRETKQRTPDNASASLIDRLVRDPDKRSFHKANVRDALAAELIRYVFELGYDPRRCVFDPSGRVVYVSAVEDKTNRGEWLLDTVRPLRRDVDPSIVSRIAKRLGMSKDSASIIYEQTRRSFFGLAPDTKARVFADYVEEMQISSTDFYKLLRRGTNEPPITTARDYYRSRLIERSDKRARTPGDSIILVLGLLAFLHRKGYCVTSTVFDDSGSGMIQMIPERGE